MAEQSLIVLLDAKTAKLDAKLKTTDEKLAKLDERTKKTDKSFLSLGKAGELAVKGIAAIATAAIAVNSALSAMVLNSANNRKELEGLSRQAKTSTEDFQALAFATKQYGISAEQIADISKDISDKVGEFSAAGTGAFQDYADVLKLTKEEARTTATEFQNMSSQEVIGKMVSEMENANVAGDRMTFVLESMGSNLSKVSGLFSDNSKQLNILKARFDDVNGSLSITAGQAEGLKEVSTSFELMTSQLGNASTAISATLAPVMDDFFNDVIAIVPQATQTIIDFANSFLDAENISSQVGVNTQIQESQARILEYEAEITAFKQAQNSYAKDGGASNTRAIGQLEESIGLERVRTEELNAQLVVLDEQALVLADAKAAQGGEIGGAIGGDGGDGTGTGDEIQAIADRFKTEEELLIEKYERELEIIGENNQLKKELHNELINAMIDIDQRYEDEKQAVIDKKEKEDKKLDKDKDKQNKVDGKRKQEAADSEEKLINDGMMLAQIAFGENKAISATVAFINTAEGVTKALSKQDYAGAALTATLGAVQISSILSSSPGSTGSTGSVPSTAPAEQASFIQDPGSQLAITDSTASGSTQGRISFSDDSGDDILDAIARGLNKGQSEGRFS
jgi:hypothetical protein